MKKLSGVVLLAILMPALSWALPIGATSSLVPTGGATGTFNHIGAGIPVKDTNDVVLGVGEYIVPIFLRGSFNGWGTGNEMTYDAAAQSYEVVMDLGAGDWEFKIASDDWATVDLGAGGGDPNVALDTPHVLGPGAFGNLFLNITSAGLYSFLLDTSGSLDSPILLISAVMSVAEPGTVALLGMALLGLGVSRRWRRN